jgi:hypothetical protein
LEQGKSGTARKTGMKEITKNTAEEINEKHLALLGLARRGLDSAIEIGLLLQRQKESLHHGEWGEWVNANLSFDERQARKYVQLADNRELLANRNCDSDLGIDAAIKEIRKIKAEEEEPDPLEDLFALAEKMGERDGIDCRQVPRVLNQIRDLSGQQISRIREWETTLKAAMKTWHQGESLSEDEREKVRKALNWHQEEGW